MSADRALLSEAGDDKAPDTARSTGFHALRLRPWAVTAAWVLGVIAAFAANLQLARTRAVNSDGASQALQAWDMLHGNLLLHGWSLGDVSFYTTELPQYMLVEFVRGLNQDVVHVAAAMTYTLAMLLAALLAKGNATGRQALGRVLIAVGIMLAPQLASGVNILLSSPDHIGTSVPVMVVWLILDRARRPRWYVPVIAGAFLGWAVVADTLVLYIGVLPLALVCAIRVCQAVAVERKPLASQWYDMALGAAALAGAAAAVLALHVIHARGGFYMPAPATQFAQSGTTLVRNLGITAQGLLLLGGADFLGLRLTASTVFTVLHLAGVFLAAWGTWLAARRFLRDRDLVAQLLVTGVAINLAAYVLSTKANVVTPDPRDRMPCCRSALPWPDACWPGGSRRPSWCRSCSSCCSATWSAWPARSVSRRWPRRTSSSPPGCGPASAHRPVRLLGVERRHADQRRPGPDPDCGTVRRTAHPQHL